MTWQYRYYLHSGENITSWSNQYIKVVEYIKKQNITGNQEIRFDLFETFREQRNVIQVM